MALVNLDDLVAGLYSGGQRSNFYKSVSAPRIAGAYNSLWNAAGNPGAGSLPPAYNSGGPYTCDNTTPGGLVYNQATVKNYLTRFMGQASQITRLILFDRLWACSGLPFGAGTYAITTPGNLPARAGDCSDVEVWLEHPTAMGTTSGTLTIDYVDENNVGRQGSLILVPSSPPVQFANRFGLHQSSLGVKQITQITRSNTWTSGSHNLILVRRLAEIPLLIPGVSNRSDWADPGIVEVPNGACLMLMTEASSTSAFTLTGSLHLVDK